MWDYYLKEKKHRKEKTLKHQGLNTQEKEMVKQRIAVHLLSIQ